MRKHFFKKVERTPILEVSTKNMKASNNKKMDKVKPIYSLGEFKKVYASERAIIDAERNNVIVNSTITIINTLMRFEKHRKVLLMN